MKPRIRLPSVWFAALYIAAVATGGITDALFAEPAVDLSAYMLPDGTVPVICDKGPSDADAPHAGEQRLCDACLPSSAPGLCVLPTEIDAGNFASIGLALPKVSAECAEDAWFRPHSARGPPAA